MEELEGGLNGGYCHGLKDEREQQRNDEVSLRGREGTGKERKKDGRTSLVESKLCRS